MRILLLLFLLFSLNIYGQINEDSLKQIWNNTDLEDTLRLNTNIELTNYYLGTNQDSALIYIQQLYELSYQKDQGKYMAIANNKFGIYYHNIGKPDSALKYYDIAIVHSKENDNYKLIAGSMINKAMIIVRQGDKQKGIELYKNAIEICDKIGELAFKLNALNNMAVVYLNEGNVDQAIPIFREVIEIASKKDFGSKAHMGGLVNLAYSLAKKGDHARAIANLNECIQLAEKKQNNNILLYAYNFLGSSYSAMGEDQNAKISYEKSYQLADSLGDLYSKTPAMINLANIAKNEGDFVKARRMYTESLDILMSLKNLGSAIEPLSNLAYLDMMDGNLDSARSKFNRGLMIAKELEQIDQEAMHYIGLGDLAIKEAQYGLAIKNFENAYKIAIEIESLDLITTSSQKLAETYEKLGKETKALQYYKEFVKYKDSIQRDENRTAALKQEFRYQYEKKASTDSLRTAKEKEITDAQLATQEAQLKHEQTQRYALIGGLGLLGLFGGLMYNRFQLTRKQNKIIEQQKLEVEDSHDRLSEKNREIMDSIAYAKRIQNAILPPNRIVKEYLKDSFILYLPKDVVAGDFYWMESIGDLVMFAAADCTGHGVPGAMVSVICVNGLNRSVREFGLNRANDILNKTRELVIKEFEKSEEEVKDGMDISLCVLNTKTNELNWAGAHNPLWIVKEGKEEIFEIKGDKQPIGKFELAKPFTDHKVQLEKGDTLYLFTDGFPDQFGGEKGKKYKSLNFKKTLIQLAKKDIHDQERILEKEFSDWKGHHEHLDDVCVIGVKV